jgi:hypothetical protein
MMSAQTCTCRCKKAEMYYMHIDITRQNRVLCPLHQLTTRQTSVLLLLLMLQLRPDRV